jgi:hypothetical protein
MITNSNAFLHLEKQNDIKKIYRSKKQPVKNKTKKKINKKNLRYTPYYYILQKWKKNTVPMTRHIHN